MINILQISKKENVAIVVNRSFKVNGIHLNRSRICSRSRSFTSYEIERLTTMSEMYSEMNLTYTQGVSTLN